MQIEEFKKVIAEMFYKKRDDPNRIIPRETLGNWYKKLKINSKNNK